MVVRLSARCGGFLRTLSLRGCEGVNSTTVRSVTTRWKGSVTTIVMMLQNYMTIHVHVYQYVGVILLSLCLYSPPCSTFSSNCKLIETLILSKCHQLSDSAIEALSVNCANLRHLNLSSCRGITDESCRFLA